VFAKFEWPFLALQGFLERGGLATSLLPELIQETYQTNPFPFLGFFSPCQGLSRRSGTWELPFTRRWVPARCQHDDAENLGNTLSP
jgi:hypothetical protein